MSVSSGAKSVAGVGKGGVQDGIEHLQDRLLYETIHSHWNTQLPPSSQPSWLVVPFCCSTLIDSDPLLLALEDSALRPVGLLWPLLTSPTPSRPVARAVVRCAGQGRRSLEVRRAFFSRTRRIYPHGVPHDHGASPSLAGLPTPHWPDIRRDDRCHRYLFVASEISPSAFFRSRLATGPLA